MSESGSLTVTTWFLEQTAPGDLRDAQVPQTRPDRPDGSDVSDGADGSGGSDVRVMRAEVPSPEFSRFLYTSVGSDVAWTDRLPWTPARWREFLDRPGVETWVAYERGTPAGFIELDGARSEGTVEISYFGLLPAFRGRRIGAGLLSYGTARAWDIDMRWPGKQPTGRVWVHTCSKDGPHALANYQRRGFRLFRTEVAEEPAAHPEGPRPAPM